jgi:cytochrome c oxidase subunit III
MRERAVDVDVSGLPSVEFGPKSLLWWGTLGFMVIEGFTLLLAVAAYLYLRMNQDSWPPAPIPPPDLLIPTINTILLLALMVPMRAADEAAKKYDREGVVKWLLVATLLTIPAVVLRWFDLTALNVRWDSNAYGSAAWAVVLLHGTLILFDLFETGALTVLFASGYAQVKHYPDASDAALYQYYLSLSWIPLYLIIYWGPRVL